jgi:rubrerythrin
MEAVIEKALRELIISEKNNFDFYCRAAEMVKDDRTRRVFEHLACGEIGYMHVFTTIYLGSEHGIDIKNLTKLPPDRNYPPYCALVDERTSNSEEQRALEISLREVLACIKRYSSLATDLNNPRLCAIFTRALRKTYAYYGIIHREYLRVAGTLGMSQSFSCVCQ